MYHLCAHNIMIFDIDVCICCRSTTGPIDHRLKITGLRGHFIHGDFRGVTKVVYTDVTYLFAT